LLPSNFTDADSQIQANPNWLWAPEAIDALPWADKLPNADPSPERGASQSSVSEEDEQP
jgi:hypothetical protein